MTGMVQCKLNERDTIKVIELVVDQLKDDICTRIYFGEQQADIVDEYVKKFKTLNQSPQVIELFRVSLNKSIAEML